MEIVKIHPRDRVYDSSFLSLFQSCEKKCYWKHFHGGFGINIPREPIALAFGSAIHDGLPVWEKGGSVDEACAVAIKRFNECGQEDGKRSILYVDNLIRGYVTHYGKPLVYRKNEDGSPMLEVEFTLFIGEICVRGRLDGIGEFDNGIWVVDKKTSSSFSSYFLDKFRRDMQMKTYYWALKSLIGKCSGIMIDMLKVSETMIRFEDGVGKREARNVDDFYFRQPLIFDDYAIVLYENLVKLIDKKIQACIRDNEWQENLGECFQYGECPFLWLCEMPDKVEALIEQRFAYNKER